MVVVCRLHLLLKKTLSDNQRSGKRRGTGFSSLLTNPIPQLLLHLLLEQKSRSLGTGTGETERLEPETTARRSVREAPALRTDSGPLDAGGIDLSPGDSLD